MRSIGLDIHRDFCEVAIAEGGEIRSAGRIEMTPGGAGALRPKPRADDRVALEVERQRLGGGADHRAHVARVVVVSPADTAIRSARAKTDRLDARARRSSSPRARLTRSGCPTSRPGRCAGGFRVDASWSG